MLRVQEHHNQEKAKTSFLRATTPWEASEAESLAAYCGEAVIRLCGLRDLIKELPQLGRVKAVTSNKQAVHEKADHYQVVKLWDHQGRVYGNTTHLRLSFNHWHYGFAVKAACDDGFRHSLQFFDRDGAGIHKVYLTEGSHRKFYESLVACYRSSDQRPRQSVGPVPRPLFCADGGIDLALFRQLWCDLQDIHDLPALFRNFGVTRIQGLRLAGYDLATPVALPALQRFMERLRDAALSVAFYVGNSGMMQVHTGVIKHLRSTGLWYTALGTDFALHLYRVGIASAWIVRKPKGKAIVSCLDLFNRAGESVLQIFAQAQPEEAEHDIWQRLLATLETRASQHAGGHPYL